MPQSSDATPLLGRLLLIIAVVIGVVIVDVLTKSWAETQLSRQGTLVVTPFFNLRLGYNTGISFGLFRAGTASEVAMLIGMQGLVITGLTVLAVRSRMRMEQVAFALILGGAVSNIIDRLSDGAVTDFLDVHLAGWHWPTFNMADVAITCGVALLLVTTYWSAQVDEVRV